MRRSGGRTPVFSNDVLGTREGRELRQMKMSEVAKFPSNYTLLRGVHLGLGRNSTFKCVVRLECVGWAFMRNTQSAVNLAYDEDCVLLRKELDSLDTVRLIHHHHQRTSDGREQGVRTRWATTGCSRQVNVATPPPSNFLNMMSLSALTMARYAEPYISASTGEESCRFEVIMKRLLNGLGSASAT